MFNIGKKRLKLLLVGHLVNQLILASLKWLILRHLKKNQHCSGVIMNLGNVIQTMHFWLLLFCLCCKNLYWERKLLWNRLSFIFWQKYTFKTVLGVRVVLLYVLYDTGMCNRTTVLAPFPCTSSSCWYYLRAGTKNHKTDTFCMRSVEKAQLQFSGAKSPGSGKGPKSFLLFLSTYCL